MIDTRFLVVHPRTALWAVQRVDCQRCVHMLPGETAMRCSQAPISSNGSTKFRQANAYCIDAREPEGVCGPEAKLFVEAKVCTFCGQTGHRASNCPRR